MTANEVIENLKMILEEVTEDENSVCYVTDCDKETLEMAIQALKKQIPKKPKHKGCYDNEGVWHTWNGINGVPYDLCPNCEINLCTDGYFGRDKKTMKYCENCGQKLDWETTL